MDLDSGRRLRSRYDHVARWVLIEGNRLLITAGVVLGFFAFVWALVASGVLSVGPRSPVRTILGSGVVAGLFSLISVTLLINQLISSRVFGTLNTLQDKLEGGTELRETVSDIAEHPSPPIYTAGFISFTGETLQEQVDRLRGDHEHRDESVQEAIDSYCDEMTEYSDVVQEVSSEMPAEKVISTLAGPEFAHHLDQTEELRTSQHANLTRDERDSLDTIAKLLGVITVFRQYYKTIALHQELAQLTRQFIFIGFPAVAVALLVPLVYQTNPPNVLMAYPLAPLVSASYAIVLSPLVLLMAYMLRIATIFRYTVSVAPFVPPVEWPWSGGPD